MYLLHYCHGRKRRPSECLRWWLFNLEEQRFIWSQFLMAKASLKSSEPNNKTKHNIPPEKHHHYSSVLMIWLSDCTGKLYKCRMYPCTKRCWSFPKGQVKLLRNFLFLVHLYWPVSSYIKIKNCKTDFSLFRPDQCYLDLSYLQHHQPASLVGDIQTLQSLKEQESFTWASITPHLKVEPAKKLHTPLEPP